MHPTDTGRVSSLILVPRKRFVGDGVAVVFVAALKSTLADLVPVM